MDFAPWLAGRVGWSSGTDALTVIDISEILTYDSLRQIVYSNH